MWYTQLVLGWGFSEKTEQQRSMKVEVLGFMNQTA